VTDNPGRKTADYGLAPNLRARECGGTCVRMFLQPHSLFAKTIGYEGKGDRLGRQGPSHPTILDCGVGIKNVYFREKVGLAPMEDVCRSYVLESLGVLDTNCHIGKRSLKGAPAKTESFTFLKCGLRS
ncbi:hypothetical protein J6590_106366, partial [Homalodisca vitripennis]